MSFEDCRKPLRDSLLQILRAGSTPLGDELDYDYAKQSVGSLGEG